MTVDNPLATVPSGLGQHLTLFLNIVKRRLEVTNGILWAQINKTGSNIADIESRDHASLQNILTGDPSSSDGTRNKHVANNDLKLAQDHRAATSAHGASGDIIGTTDTATNLVRGPVFQAASVADAAASSVTGSTTSVSVTTADADATYGTEEADLINEIKADVNTLAGDVNTLAGDVDDLVTDVNAIKDSLNSLLANLRTSEALDT